MFKKLFILALLITSVQAHAYTVIKFTPINAVSMGATITGAAEPISNVLGFSLQGTWTGSTAAGDIKIQVSNDGTNWFDLANSDQTISGAGGYFWNVNDVFYYYMRVLYTRVSGTGSLTVIQVNKGQ